MNATTSVDTTSSVTLKKDRNHKNIDMMAMTTTGGGDHHRQHNNNNNNNKKQHHNDKKNLKKAHKAQEQQQQQQTSRSVVTSTNVEQMRHIDSSMNATLFASSSSANSGPLYSLVLFCVLQLLGAVVIQEVIIA